MAIGKKQESKPWSCADPVDNDSYCVKGTLTDSWKNYCLIILSMLQLKPNSRFCLYGSATHAFAKAKKDDDEYVFLSALFTLQL